MSASAAGGAANILGLHFEGWFQCRLATNPDPSDEPRGVSGYTFALAGEPDLDRVIRLQNPVAPRSHAPPVDVRVSEVVLDGRPVPDHPLQSAPVEWLDEPRFESRNLLLTEDRAGIGIIHPFHLRISAPPLVLRARDHLYPEDPELPIHRVPAPYLARRAPSSLDGMRRDPLRIADATGITDPLAYRRRRLELLRAELDGLGPADPGLPEKRAALDKRIRELSVDDPRDLRVLSLSLVQAWSFELRGECELSDPKSLLAGGPEEAPWRVELWMGGWDADVLCGYLRGLLEIPWRPERG